MTPFDKLCNKAHVTPVCVSSAPAVGKNQFYAANVGSGIRVGSLFGEDKEVSFVIPNDLIDAFLECINKSRDESP